jgi:hypothetical protein
VNSKKQNETYKKMLEMGWEYYEEFPVLGEIVMRKNVSSSPDFFSWEYVTINIKGKVLENFRR